MPYPYSAFLRAFGDQKSPRYDLGELARMSMAID
jgi:hypothetical protein